MPDKPRHASSPRLSVTEQWAPGVRETGLEAPTSPPPAPDRRPAPRQYQAPRPSPQAVVVPPLAVPRAPTMRDYEEEATLHGVGPASEPPDVRDSQEISTDSILAELAKKSNEARAAKAEAETLRQALDAAKRATVIAAPAPPVEAPTPAHWNVLLYKAGGALVAILVPCGVYLTYRVESLVPRVDSTQQHQVTQQTTTETIEDRVKSLESYNRALMAHSDCVDAERDSAIERGTGHTVEGQHGSVSWFEQAKPTVRPRILWENFPWYVTTPCPPKPHPPGNP